VLIGQRAVPAGIGVDLGAVQRLEHHRRPILRPIKPRQIPAPFVSYPAQPGEKRERLYHTARVFLGLF
jgi:hypothetical protein